MRLFRRFTVAITYAWLAFGAPALASQASLVTPGSPLPMTGLASFLDAAFLSVGSCNSGDSAPANGTGGAAFAGECWWNTTSTTWVLSFTSDGTHWGEVGTLNSAVTPPVWTPYWGGAPLSATNPLSLSLTGGAGTVALNYDSNFANNGSNQLAFNPIASGDLLANSGSGSAEPTGITPSAWLNRWCSSSQYQFPQAGASSWVCGTISGLLIAGAGITLTGTGQVTVAIANTAVTAGSYGGAASIPTFTVNQQGQLTAANSVTSNPTQVNGNAWPSSGTSGGVAYWSAANTVASSAALAQNGIVVGGGAGAAPSTISKCSAAQLILGQTAAPACETMSGDATIGNTGALTLATVNSNTGTFGSATAVPQITFDGKGRATAVTTVSVNPFAQVTSPTSNAIYRGQGASAPIASALSDDATNVYSTEPVDLKGKPLLTEIANSSSGTTANKLAKLSSGQAVTLTTSDTQGIIGVVVSGAGTSGNALIAISGQSPCAFDGTATAGDYVQASSSIAGDCSDIGATYPGSGQALGRVTVGGSGAGTYTLLVFPPEERGGSGGGSGTVTSVDIVNSTGLGESGTCNSTSSINCTLSVTNPVNATAPTQTIYTAGSGTYTVPAGVKWLHVRMEGGGGGGSGENNNSSGANGVAGNNSTFGTSFLTAAGGTPGISGNNSGGGGGSASGGDINITGGNGSIDNASSLMSAIGGASPLGAGGATNNGGGTAGTGYGSGGGGARYGTLQQGGGGAGGYLEKLITSPAASYSYVVGSGGAGGSSSVWSGGNGAGGIIIIEEHYNY